MTGFIVVVVLGVLLLAFYFFLSWQSDKETREFRETMRDLDSLSKDECKKLIVQALEKGEELSATGEPLQIDDNCMAIWAALPKDFTSFLSRYGRIEYGPDGYVGGRISLVSSDEELMKLLSSIEHGDSKFAQGVVFGRDEWSIYFALPNEERVFEASGADELSAESTVSECSHFFKMLVSSAVLYEQNRKRPRNGDGKD